MANCSKHLQACAGRPRARPQEEKHRVYGLAGDDVVALYSALHRGGEPRGGSK
jgi:hypothetical protein